MSENKKIPSRNEVNPKDKWDLSALYSNDESWEDDLKKLESMIPKISTYQGRLKESIEVFSECLDYLIEIEKLDERLGYYAFLKKDEDLGSSKYQDMMSRYMSVATKAGAAGSYVNPEIQAIPEDMMKSYLVSGKIDDHKIALEKLLRFKAHILSEKEEKLLALQAEANQTAQRSFSALTDVDLDFGEIDGKPLSQSTLITFLLNPDRKIREKAYMQFYTQFDKHKNTLTSLYAGSVHLDVYQARIRNYENSRQMSLFPDKVPETVYDNLVSAVNSKLPYLHDYYKLRREVLNLDKLAHYDVMVPIVGDIKIKHSYEQAVEKVLAALKPLGEEYCSTLKSGLLGRWVDRYENKGKRSGAYSAGSYQGDQYILINFKEDVLRDVFTLAHEGGHSMHSWYSVKNNPFQHYNYTIFEAEVASTFNEQLLFRYLLENTADPQIKAYLINKQIDDFLATLYRQTMFAEFEDLSHRKIESGESLTVDSIKSLYRGLLDKYFGSEVELFDFSELECLRIPHFYRAFYVYKYATGISAAVTLAKRVLEGGQKERDDYISFLKSGGSRYPLESLKIAGVDMSETEPVESALNVFGSLVSELRSVLGK